MTKTDYAYIKTLKLMELLDEEYSKVCKECKGVVSNIVEMELELEGRSNN